MTRMNEHFDLTFIYQRTFWFCQKKLSTEAMGMWQTTNTIVTRYSNFVPVVGCDTFEETLSMAYLIHMLTILSSIQHVNK